jgi:hypothetical protein
MRSFLTLLFALFVTGCASAPSNLRQPSSGHCFADRECNGGACNSGTCSTNH